MKLTEDIKSSWILSKGEFEMKHGQYIKEEKLLKKGIDILMEKLGPVETNRFLSIPSQKRMESLKRHHKWQSQLEKEAFFNKVCSVQ